MCQITNVADTNLDGCVQLNDLLDLLSAYGNCAADESVWQCGEQLEYHGHDYKLETDWPSSAGLQKI